MNIPAIFSDYCEEACNLGASCITSVTGCPLARPVSSDTIVSSYSKSIKTILLNLIRSYYFNLIMFRICSSALQIQLNPFRQPMAVEGSALFLPCYSNCFLYGMWTWVRSLTNILLKIVPLLASTSRAMWLWMTELWFPDQKIF